MTSKGRVRTAHRLKVPLVTSFPGSRSPGKEVASLEACRSRVLFIDNTLRSEYVITNNMKWLIYLINYGWLIYKEKQSVRFSQQLKAAKKKHQKPNEKSGFNGIRTRANTDWTMKPKSAGRSLVPLTIVRWQINNDIQGRNHEKYDSGGSRERAGVPGAPPYF